MNLLKRTRTLSHGEIRLVAVMCATAGIIIAAAVLLGGDTRVLSQSNQGAAVASFARGSDLALVKWNGEPGDTGERRAPSCPSGATLESWVPVSSLVFWTSIGLCSGSGESPYTLVKWNGEPGEVEEKRAPTCPTSKRLIDWVSISSVNFWTTVGLCGPLSDTPQDDTYRLVKWNGDYGDTNQQRAPECPSGTGLVNWVSVSSYNFWTTVGICFDEGLDAGFPNVTITGNGTNPASVEVGESVVVRATFAPASGDRLVRTAVNDYENRLWCGTNCNPGAAMWTQAPLGAKQYTFTPTAPGTYAFYPAVQTEVHTRWNDYGKILRVTVTCSGEACTEPPPEECPPGTIDVDGVCEPVEESDVCENIDGMQTVPPQNGYSSSGECYCAPGFLLDTEAGECVVVDVCSNFPGAQGSAPQNGSENGDGTCSCEDGYTQVGAQCLPPQIGSFYASPALVLSGNRSQLYWRVSQPPASCRITGSDGSNWSIPRAQLASGSIGTQPITAVTTFTMRCTGASAREATVRLIPTFEEQ